MKDMTPDKIARLNEPIREGDIHVMDIVILGVLFWLYLPKVIAGIVLDILRYEGPESIQRIIRRYQP
jgi:hypothetical protein